MLSATASFTAGAGLSMVGVLTLLATCVSDMFSRHRCINVFGVLALTLAIAAAFVSRS